MEARSGFAKHRRDTTRQIERPLTRMCAPARSAAKWRPGCFSSTRTARTCTPSRRSEQRRVGKECRSLCDWSSDVCSTDLREAAYTHVRACQKRGEVATGLLFLDENGQDMHAVSKIGTASCRERV